MNKKILKILIIIIFICLSIFCVNRVVSVKADSGWDTDYDSNSSWDSGSSWDSSNDMGSSYDSYDNDDSNSSGSGGSCVTKECKRNRLIVGIIPLVFVIGLVFIIIIIKLPKKAKNQLFMEFLSVISFLLSIIIGIILFPSLGFASLIFLPIGIVLFNFFNPHKKKSKYNRINQNFSDSISNYTEISSQSANNIIPNFDIEEFKSKAYQIFYDTQIGWMEFDYDKLKNILSDELYNMYEMELEALKIKNQKNVMKDFELINLKLNTLYEDGKNYCAKVILEVKFIDYVEDSIKHKVLRGSDKTKVDNTYMLIFIRSKDEKGVNKCPKCGAEVKGNASGVCEYCRAKLINNSYDWVMSKKEKISQR